MVELNDALDYAETLRVIFNRTHDEIIKGKQTFDYASIFDGVKGMDTADSNELSTFHKAAREVFRYYPKEFKEDSAFRNKISPYIKDSTRQLFAMGFIAGLIPSAVWDPGIFLTILVPLMSGMYASKRSFVDRLASRKAKIPFREKGSSFNVERWYSQTLEALLGIENHGPPRTL